GFDLGIWTLHKNDLESNNTDENEIPDVFSLKGDEVIDIHAKRKWSRSYLNLTNSTKLNENVGFAGKQTPVVNWINVQESPEMLSPYKAGAATSSLLTMFDPHLAQNGKTHHDVKLSREALDKIAFWIDALVPFCGDYFEANSWNEQELSKYHYYETKKKNMAELDKTSRIAIHENANKNLTKQTVQKTDQEKLYRNFYRNLAYNPNAKEIKEGENIKNSPGQVSSSQVSSSQMSESEKEWERFWMADERSKQFPAASSNSVCRGEKAFAASNCINGNTANKGHGDAFPSWGPDQNVENLYWNVDFGKSVLVDQVAIWIRADFPHDTFWKECVIECSNGFKKKISLEKTANRQLFCFPPQKIEWLRLTDFVPAESGWAALTEVEVMGIDEVSRSYNPPGW
ncbi:MAG: hypothetical protein ACRCUY_06380, partial [Thermoguttaceae bacterium]